MGKSEYKTKQAVTSSSQLSEESFCQTRVFRSLSDTVEVSITRGVDETGSLNQKEYRFEAVLRGGIDPYNVDDDGNPIQGAIQFDRPETFERFAVIVGYALGVSISPLTVDPRVELSVDETLNAQARRSKLEERPIEHIDKEHAALLNLLECIEEKIGAPNLTEASVLYRASIAMEAVRSHVKKDSE